MGRKLITMLDPITNDPIYPTTSASLVLNQNGSNIHGIFTKQTETIKSGLKDSIGEIKQTNRAISKLLYLSTSTREQKELADRVVQSSLNLSKAGKLENTVRELEEKATTLIKKTSDEIYNSSGLIDLVRTVFGSKNFITYGTPKYAPKGKEIRVGIDGKVYIGLYGIWYAINAAEIIRIDNGNVELENEAITIINGTGSYKDGKLELDSAYSSVYNKSVVIESSTLIITPSTISKEPKTLVISGGNNYLFNGELELSNDINAIYNKELGELNIVTTDNYVNAGDLVIDEEKGSEITYSNGEINLGSLASISGGELNIVT